MHAAQNRMPGTVVRARLCRGTDGLVYVLTVLAHDGKVARIAVDAMKGTLGRPTAERSVNCASLSSKTIPTSTGSSRPR